MTIRMILIACFLLVGCAKTQTGRFAGMKPNEAAEQGYNKHFPNDDFDRRIDSYPPGPIQIAVLQYAIDSRDSVNNGYMKGFIDGKQYREQNPK